MATLKFLRGDRTSLEAVEKHDGYIYFCMDDTTIHIDFIDGDGIIQRKQLNANDAETLGGYDVSAILGDTKTQTEEILNIANGIGVLDGGVII